MRVEKALMEGRELPANNHYTAWVTPISQYLAMPSGSAYSALKIKGQILPQQQGAIDVSEMQTLAAGILEGGKSAFNQRR